MTGTVLFTAARRRMRRLLCVVACLLFCCGCVGTTDSTTGAIELRYRDVGNTELCYLVQQKEAFATILDMWCVSAVRNDRGGISILQREGNVATLLREGGGEEEVFYRIDQGRANLVMQFNPSDMWATAAITDVGVPENTWLGQFPPAWFPRLPAEPVTIGEKWHYDVPMVVGTGRGMDVVSRRLPVAVNCRLIGLATPKGTQTRCAIIEYSCEVSVRESRFKPEWKGTLTITQKGKAWFGVDRGVVIKKTEVVTIHKDFDASPPQGDFHAEINRESLLMNAFCLPMQDEGPLLEANEERDTQVRVK